MWIHHFLKQMDVLAPVPPIFGSRLLENSEQIGLSQSTAGCRSSQTTESNLIQLHKSKSCFRECSWVVFPGIKYGHCVILLKGRYLVVVPMTIDNVTNFCYHLDNCTGTELCQNEFRA